MLAPLIVPEIVPARYARLLLESSHASPPSSRQSFQKPTVNFNASIVSLLLMTTLPLSSLSAPPKHYVIGYAHWLGWPSLWPNASPVGRPFSFSPASTVLISSHMSGAVE